MVIFIEGKRNSGKTGLINSLAAELRRRGIKFAGVVSPAEYSRGKKTRYYVRSLKTGTRKHLLEISENGPVVDKKGFRYANRVLRSASSCGLVFIDEFGPLELYGGGFFKPVKNICSDRKKTAIITIREGLLEKSAAALGIKEYKVIKPGETPGKITKILSFLRPYA